MTPEGPDAGGASGGPTESENGVHALQEEVERWKKEARETYARESELITEIHRQHLEISNLKEGGAGEPGRRRRVMRTATMVLFAYFSAFLAVNAIDSPLVSDSPLHAVISALVPRIGSSSGLQTESLQQEWDLIKRYYVVQGVSGGNATLASEQGIISYLHGSFDDRFSAVLAPRDSTALQDTLSGKLSGGIGIGLDERCGPTTLCGANQKPALYVLTDVLTGKPADRAGLRNNDVLETVDGTDVYKLNSNLDAGINQVIAKVKGAAGTRVTIGIKRGNVNLTFTVTRANLNIPSVYSTMMGKVLYIELNTFGNDTAADFKKQLSQGISAGATGVVLDLRDDGGGLVDAAVSIVSKFLTPGPNEKDVVVRRGRMLSLDKPQSAEEVKHDQIAAGGVDPHLPLAVLVNGDTASAAEITSMAIRDYHRGTLVGTKTFGKGSVQTDFTLADGNDLHLTIERWFGPDGETIEGKGITPDRQVALASPFDFFRLETVTVDPSKDAQLQAALALFKP